MTAILLAVMIALLWIGTALFNLARKNKLPNLYWLALSFFAAVLALPFAPTAGNPLSYLPVLSLWWSTSLFVIASGILIVFIQTTFYLHKKSPVGWFLGVYAVLTLVTVYGLAVSESNFNQSPWVAAGNVISLLVWAWHGGAAGRAFQSVARDRTVEDWVKSRYAMMTAYATLVAVGAAASVIRVVAVGGGTSHPLGNAMALVFAVCQILSVGLQYLVWVMPDSFRRWLNRHYQPPLRLDLNSLTEDDVFKRA